MSDCEMDPYVLKSVIKPLVSRLSLMKGHQNMLKVGQHHEIIAIRPQLEEVHDMALPRLGKYMTLADQSSGNS